MTTSIGNSGSTTGAITSTGIGSGLDVNSIISGLMRVERLPLTDLTRRATGIQATISSFGAVQSAMSSFRDTAAALALPSTWNATNATSTDASSVGVSTSADASPGNYSVQVTRLAAAQSTVSGTFASSAALVGSGTLHIDLGSYNADQTAFTAQAGKNGVDITVSATDTLDTLAGKINGASAGITASVVNDASGARLVYSASTTGTANTFRVSAVDSDGSNTDANGLSAIAFDPAGGTTATTQTQAAADAAATVNGLAVTSSTNTLSNVVSGLTLTLGKPTTAAVQITVAQDQDAITKSVQGFVDQYNALSSLLTTDLKYDAGTSTSGPLQGDSTARSLQSQLRGIIGSPSGASSVYSTLSQIGVETQKDGTLKFNTTKFSAAIGTNPAEVKKMFTNVDLTNPANAGFANHLRTFGDAVMGSGGLLTSRVSGLNTKLSNNQKDQDTLSDRLSKVQARLQAQYSALDTKMAAINAQSTYVTQQIANWNKSTA